MLYIINRNNKKILYKFQDLITQIVEEYTNDSFTIKIVCAKSLNSIAENIPPEDSCAKELYKDFVLFVKEDIKEDLSNIDQLYEAIDKALLINIDSDKFDLYKQVLEDKTTYLFTNSLINMIYSYLMN